MKTSSLWGLVWTNLRRDRKASFFSVLGVAVGVGSLLFFLAAGMGVGELVRTKIFPVDTSLVEVIPEKTALGLFGARPLDEEAVAQLGSLEGVSAAYRKMQIRVPAVSRYDGNFFGQRLRMGLEILGEGVEPALLSDAFAGEGWDAVAFDDAGDGPVPFVASPRLLEIYNKSFAKARGLPQLSPSLLRGFEMPLEFGRSYVGRDADGGARLRTSGKLVGFSNRSMLQGITVPLETAKRINERFGEDTSTYSGVILQAVDPGRLPALMEEVRALGFEIDDSERQLSERVGTVVALITLTFSLLGLLICVLASMNIALSLGASVRSRSKELGLLRAVGATSGDIGRLVMGEALAIGLLGGAAGGAGALGAAKAADLLAASWVPDFPFKPETYFIFTPGLFAMGLALGVAAALLGALAPTRGAVRQDPSRAMA